MNDVEMYQKLATYEDGTLGKAFATNFNEIPTQLPPEDALLRDMRVLRVSDSGSGIEHRPLIHNRNPRKKGVRKWGDLLQCQLTEPHTQRIVSSFSMGPAVEAARVLMVNALRVLGGERSLADFTNTQIPNPPHPVFHYSHDYSPSSTLKIQDQEALLTEINRCIPKNKPILTTNGIRLALGIPKVPDKFGLIVGGQIPPYPHSNPAISTWLRNHHPRATERPDAIREFVFTPLQTEFVELGVRLLQSEAVHKFMPFDTQSNGGIMLARFGRNNFGACIAEVERSITLSSHDNTLRLARELGNTNVGYRFLLERPEARQADEHVSALFDALSDK